MLSGLWMARNSALGASAVSVAYAKVNLYLHVTGKRDDGYHLLDSLMAFAGAHDVLSARLPVLGGDGLSLTVDGPFGDLLEGEEDNLVLRSGRALRERFAGGAALGADIHLTKNLPVASGIGGGSADAAAALKALCRLWGLCPDADELAALALELGADVPFCLAGTAAYVGGIGEDICVLGDLPGAGILLVNPLMPLSTPAVFKARRGGFTDVSQHPGRFETSPETAADLAVLLRQRRNDLTAPAVAIMPEIDRILSAIRDLPGCLLGRMSGSGATSFGLFADEDAAKGAAEILARENPGLWIYASRLLGRI